MIQINIYIEGDEWFAARWIDGEFDGSDSLGLPDSATEEEALAAAETIPLSVDGERIVHRV